MTTPLPVAAPSEPGPVRHRRRPPTRPGTARGSHRTALRRAPVGGLLALVLVGVTGGTAWAASSGTGSVGSGSAPASTAGGTASVAFAGSLLHEDNVVVGPAFTKATGDGYSGVGAGSDALAQEIVSGEISPGVFESVGSAPIATIEPKFTHWYVQLAASPLVIAYNPQSPDAAVFAKARAGDKASLRKVFEAMASPGFLLGRTDPATDPQGQAFVMMVELAQRDLGLPKDIVDEILGTGATSGGGNVSQIFAETSLDSTLEAGQLDAASAYLSQAVQLHLPYVALPDAINMGEPSEARTYATAHVTVPDTKPGTTTTVHGTPLVVDATTVKEASSPPADTAAADAFVVYLLSSAGRKAYAEGGYTLLPAVVTGKRADVPTTILDAVARAAKGSSGT